MEYGDFVVRVRGTAAEWNVVQEPVKYGRGMDFDEFMRLVHGT
ncbi:hypothetical protein EDD95_7859 [Streptomyces sp. CEV 2-1]|nr:hypothetical protein [Streptomyces sp. CEV 2-1]ROQ71729.1 hypothetical protein EDD95_7859 [Streptomyces sp. CEV 2-1]